MRMSNRKSKYGDWKKGTTMDEFSKSSNLKNQTVKDLNSSKVDNGRVHESGIVGNKSDLISNIGNSTSINLTKEKKSSFPDHTKRKFPLPKPHYTHDF